MRTFCEKNRERQPNECAVVQSFWAERSHAGDRPPEVLRVSHPSDRHHPGTRDQRIAEPTRGDPPDRTRTRPEKTERFLSYPIGVLKRKAQDQSISTRRSRSWMHGPNGSRHVTTKPNRPSPDDTINHPPAGPVPSPPGPPRQGPLGRRRRPHDAAPDPHGVVDALQDPRTVRRLRGRRSDEVPRSAAFHADQGAAR